MEKLPQELVDHVCSYLSISDLGNTLTLSRNFQFASETHCGAFTEYEFTENNTQDFLRVFSGHRFRLLRTIRFETSFPELEYDDDRPCREIEAQLLEKDTEFTRQMTILFPRVKSFEERLDESYLPGISH